MLNSFFSLQDIDTMSLATNPEAQSGIENAMFIVVGVAVLFLIVFCIGMVMLWKRKRMDMEMRNDSKQGN